MKIKLIKKKILKFIGQAICFIGFNAGCTAILAFGFLQNTIY